MEKSLKILEKIFSLDTESIIRESLRVFVNGVTAAAGQVSPPPTLNFTNGDKVILGGGRGCADAKKNVSRLYPDKWLSN